MIDQTNIARTSIETLFDPTPASLLGDHGVSDPPDPISNSAVKPDSADGTMAQALEE